MLKKWGGKNEGKTSRQIMIFEGGISHGSCHKKYTRALLFLPPHPFPYPLFLPSLSYPVLGGLGAFGGPGAGPLTGHEEGGGEGRAGAGMWTGHEKVYGRLRSRGMNG